jgi:hypothetical protein
VDVIRFSWGGCGNLINSILLSSLHYDQIINYYKSINEFKTWTDQEWELRHTLGQNLCHEYGQDGILLAWDNSLDTSFHYIIKNIKLNHLSGSMLDRVQIVLAHTFAEENQIRLTTHWPMTKLLQDFDMLYDYCFRANPNIDKDCVKNIFDLWKEKSAKFYKLNSQQVLDYFKELGIDYTPTIVYNILHENNIA